MFTLNKGSFVSLFKTCIGLILLCVFFVGVLYYGFFTFGETQAQTVERYLHGWMWNGIDGEDLNGNTDGVFDSGVGWMSLHCEVTESCDVIEYGVVTTEEIDADTGERFLNLSGHAWAGGAKDQDGNIDISPNEVGYGWISFNRSETANPPFDDVAAGTDSIARLNPQTGELEGWARFIAACNSGSAGECVEGTFQDDGAGWTGWIKFQYDTNGDEVDDTGVAFTLNNADPENPDDLGLVEGFAWNGDSSDDAQGRNVGVGWIEVSARWQERIIEESPLAGTLTAPNRINPGEEATLTANVTEGDDTGPFTYEYICDWREGGIPGFEHPDWTTGTTNTSEIEDTYDCGPFSDERTYTPFVKITNADGDRVRADAIFIVGDGSGPGGGCPDDDGCISLGGIDLVCKAEAVLEVGGSLQTLTNGQRVPNNAVVYWSVAPEDDTVDTTGFVYSWTFTGNPVTVDDSTADGSLVKVLYLNDVVGSKSATVSLGGESDECGIDIIIIPSGEEIEI